jgi:hypothetical protein
MSSVLENGIASAKSGDKTGARQYFKQALQENPKSISAWLWMSTVVDDIEQKKICYQRVLAIDPQNEYALKGMSQLALASNELARSATTENHPLPARQPVSPPQRKKFEYIETIESLYKTSWDVYEPCMPSVDLHANMEEFFEDARTLGVKGSSKGFKDEFYKMHPEYDGRVVWVNPMREGERFLPVITPGRMIILIPAFFDKNSKAAGAIDSILPIRKNLRITVVSHTYMQDYVNNELPQEERLSAVIKSIPFTGQMAALTGTHGHSILIFEGHPSVFEAGIKNSDVLFIDSGMLKFLQDDWGEVAFRCMNPHCKIFIHERENYKLRPVIRTREHPGWEYGVGIGNEINYEKMLFTVLAGDELRGKHILLAAGKPVPNLSQFTQKSDQLEFLSRIPFDYEQLSVQKIIKMILEHSEKKFLSSTRKYPIKYHPKGTNKVIDYSCSIRSTEDTNGNTMLDIWLD